MGAEEALRAATAKFERRFRRVEQSLSAEGRTVHDADAAELEDRWRAAKDGPC